MAKMRYTTSGPRPDLRLAAKGTQDDLGGYAFSKIFPVVIVGEPGGKIMFAPNILTAASGVKNRANGASLDSGTITPVEVSWAADRYEGREKMYSTDVQAAGTIEECDVMGATIALRKCLNKIEADAAAIVFSSDRRTAAASLSNGKIIEKLQTAAKKQRGYGKPYLVLSTESLLTLSQLPEIRAYAAGLMGAQSIGNLLMSMDGGSKLLAALSPLLGFAGLIVFDSEIVGTTYDTFVAVVSLRAEALQNPQQAISVGKRNAMYGVALVQIPDDAEGESIADFTADADFGEKCNVYDAEAHVDLCEIHGSDLASEADVNAGAVTVFKFLADLTSYTPLDSDLVQKVLITNTALVPVQVAGPVVVSGEVEVSPADGAVFSTDEVTTP